MAASKIGRNCKVTMVIGGAASVLGMGTWEIGGMSAAVVNASAFGDSWEESELGIFSGGTISFSGLYKKDDVTGQNAVRNAFYLRTNLTDIRFYVDSVSYYRPNDSTAVGLNGVSTGSPIGYVNITTAPTISADQGDFLKISFSGIYHTGPMVLK